MFRFEIFASVKPSMAPAKVMTTVNQYCDINERRELTEGEIIALVESQRSIYIPHENDGLGDFRAMRDGRA
jgi:hypothetical protein